MREMIRDARQRLLTEVGGRWRSESGRRRRHEAVAIIPSTAISAKTCRSGLRVFLSITELILLRGHALGDLLLLREGAIWTCSTCWRSDAQRILAVGQSNPPVLDEAIQGVAVQLIESLGGIPHIRKLMKMPSVIELKP